MTNLLPPQAKKQITVEYWTRVICAWVILWSVSLFVGVLLMWPTYVLLTGNNEAYSESTVAATERTNEYDELGKVLVKASAQSEEIVVLQKQKKISIVLEDIFATGNTGQVEITGITINREGTNILPVRITGEAADRLALAQLRDSLEALPFVGGVELPIENLAKNEDISFSLTVEIISEKL